MSKTLASRQGLFGPVWVRDYRGARQLLIGHQLQGGSVLEPTGVPGPVPASEYLIGWLAAGVQSPDASAVMVGLGSGAGAVALLDNFPALDLTVLEIDPAVIDLACEHFPLLNHYQDLGRLRLVRCDAERYLQEAHQRGERWDVGFCDAYQGHNDLCVSPLMLVSLLGACRDVWFNLIDASTGPSIHGLQEALQELRQPLRAIFDCQPSLPVTAPRNLVCTTQVVDANKLAGFTPFQDRQGVWVDWVRTRYQTIIGTLKPLA